MEYERTQESTEPEPTPSDVDGGLRAAHAIWIAVAFFVAQVVIGAAVAIAAVGYCASTRPRLTASLLAEIQRVILLPAALLGGTISGLVALGLTRWALRRGGRSPGLRSVGCRSASGQQVVVAAGLGLGVSGIFLALTHVFPADPTKTWGPLAVAAAAGGWQRLGWAVLALLVAPPVEEFVFRGVLWSGLVRSMGPTAAGIVVTFAFVATHVTEARSYWPAWLAISLLAVAALATRVRSGSLLPPLVLHTCYNAALVAAVYLGAA